MTAITTIRIDYAALPKHLDRSRPDVVAEVIEAELRDAGITADASDVISPSRSSCRPPILPLPAPCWPASS